MPRAKNQKKTEQVFEETTNAVQYSYDALTQDEKDQLSKALFPDTHTDEVQLLGETRKLRPTSVKVSRKLQVLVEPLLDDGDTKTDSPEEHQDKVLKTLSDVALCLAEYYGWEDVAKAVPAEEVSFVELEALAARQVDLNSINDSFLFPLRAVVKMLQAREIAAVITTGLGNMSISLPSSTGGKV